MSSRRVPERSHARLVRAQKDALHRKLKADLKTVTALKKRIAV